MSEVERLRTKVDFLKGERKAVSDVIADTLHHLNSLEDTRNRLVEEMGDAVFELAQAIQAEKDGAS